MNKTPMKIAALYARVSSDQQKKEKTINSQTEALRGQAKELDLMVPEDWVFEDEGYSGASLVRPGLDQVRDLAAAGRLDVLLVYGPDRLSRKYPYQVLLVEEFERHGVEVVFVKAPQTDTPEDRLVVQFQGMIAEYERAQISERSRRGKRHRARNGSVNVLSAAPYGYRYVRKSAFGEARYEIVEAEAAVVRRVFKTFIEDRISINAIARELNEEGIATKTGAAHWCRTTVWGMLNNPAYAGRACFGKTKPAVRQKVTRKLRLRGGYSPRSSRADVPREDWIEIPVPAVVDEASFTTAQEQLQRNRKSPSRVIRDPSLLQGMMACRHCGYAYYRTSTRTTKRKIYYYRCLGSDRYRYPDGARCDNRPVRQDVLDEAVWQSVMELLRDPALIQGEIDRRLSEARDTEPDQCRREELRGDRARIEQQLKRLLDAYQEGLVEIDELRERRGGLNERLKSIEADLQASETAAADRDRYLMLAETAENFLGRLAESARTADMEQKRKVLKLLVQNILVGKETVTVKHCIPSSGETVSGKGSPMPQNRKSYELCTRGGWSRLIGTFLTSCENTSLLSFCPVTGL